jgi:hypothetical protein
MKVKQRDQLESNLPSGLAAPARRALAGAGIERLEQLTESTEAEINALHGMGLMQSRNFVAPLMLKGWHSQKRRAIRDRLRVR